MRRTLSAGVPGWDMRFGSPDLGPVCERSKDVYEPAEDTFLIMDAMEGDASLLAALRPLVVLEVGSGSGCVSVFVCAMLREVLGRHVLSLATDINASACAETMRCAGRPANGRPPVGAVRCDLVAPLRRCAGIDVLIFNPPYVPSDYVGGPGVIDAAWAGGERGREPLDRLLRMLLGPDGRCLLSPRALAYIAVLEENGVADVVRAAIETGVFCSGSVVLSRKFGVERLHIVRLIRKP